MTSLAAEPRDAAAGDAVKVSVVVPVWNPGPNLTRCVDSLLAQTMPATDYEVVFVDDGSSDGTAARLDELAAAHRQVRVIHIPNSGWPGRPRNVGVDAARGEYVHFVDNDDTLPPYALAALYTAGRECDADLVMGRPESDFRGLNHTIYRRELRGATIASNPELAETLTPHKMFRRAMLAGGPAGAPIRFPEGPVPLEDQFYLVEAYLRARSIAVLVDRPYYSYLRRIGSGRNAGDRHIDPVAHFEALGRVLDVIEANATDPAVRDALLRRCYRVVLLPRLADRAMIDADEPTRRAVFDQVRRVVGERLGPAVRDSCGAGHRVQGRLLLDGDLPGTVALARRYVLVGVRAWARSLRWETDARTGRAALRVEVDGGLYWREQPGDEPRLMRCEPAGAGWALPEALAPGSGLADRELDPARDEADVELAVISRHTSLSLGTIDGLSAGPDPDGYLRVRGVARIDPTTILGGGRLTDGLWDLRVRLRFAGFNRATMLWAPPDGPDATALPPPVLVPGTARAREWVAITPYPLSKRGAFALDVGQWARPLARALAESAVATVEPRRTPPGARRRWRLRLRVGLARATPDLPAVQVLLAPDAASDAADGTAGGGLISATAVLRPEAGDPERATAGFALPALPPDRRWRLWLRVPALAADQSAVPAMALGWRLRTGPDPRDVPLLEPWPEPVDP